MQIEVRDGTVYAEMTPLEAMKMSGVMVLAEALIQGGEEVHAQLSERWQHNAAVAVAAVLGYLTPEEVRKAGRKAFGDRGVAAIKEIAGWGLRLADAAHDGGVSGDKNA